LTTVDVVRMTVDVVIKSVDFPPGGVDTELYPKKTGTWGVRDFFERRNEVRIVEPLKGKIYTSLTGQL
jgi:hypothetical protein